MEEEDEDSLPFWLHRGDPHRRHYHPGNRSSSLFFNSGVLIILLLAIAASFIFIIVPSFSSKSQNAKPNLVKKSWDSLNLVLVLFAIICAFLCKNDGNEDRSVANGSQEVQKSNPSTPKWYQYSDRTAYPTLNRLRSSNSYPDLRQESLWLSSEDRWRFYDDTRINDYHGLESDQLLVHRKMLPELADKEDLDNTLSLAADSFVVESEKVLFPPPPITSPPLQPQKVRETYQDPALVSAAPASPPKVVKPRRKANRTYEAIPRKENGENLEIRSSEVKYFPKTPPAPPQTTTPPPTTGRAKRKARKAEQEPLGQRLPVSDECSDLDVRNLHQTPTAPTPPRSPSPPPASPPELEQSSGKIGKKRGSANATKDFLTSLYQQSQRKKKKKQRQKSIENLESIFNIQPSSPPLHPPPPPPTPPPPPPPPPSVFHSLFSSRKGKTKKINSDPPPPPPPPPPPHTSTSRPSKIRSNIAFSQSNTTNLTTRKPIFLTNTDETPNSGSESPLNPIPQPPPLPPSNTPPYWRFEMHGDYVRIRSINSSRSSSPEKLYESDTSTINESRGTATGDGGDLAATAAFCSSPDVNTKADSFIARFRAGLKLEKMDSINEKQGRVRSNLGPGPVPNPGPD